MSGSVARVEVVLVEGEWRSPTLRTTAPLAGRARYSSVSNTDGLSAIAWSDVRVGVDLEVVRSRPRLDELARRVMTAPEQARWLDADDRLVAFLCHWTRYEAYVKAIGVGIAAGFHARPGREWSVVDLELPSTHVGALVVDSTNPVVTLRRATVPETSG